MEMLKSMKQTLIAQAQNQMGNLQAVDAKELGEVIDMIKDLEEAIYYCTIVKAMEEKEENSNSNEKYAMYYPIPPIDYYRDIDRDYGKMYYDGDGSSTSSSSDGNGVRHYAGYKYPKYHRDGDYYTPGEPRDYKEREYADFVMRDSREGRSPMSRKSYMESKEMHHDKSKQIQELEKYMQELSTDVVEMIKDASPEERQILQRKLQALSNKIEQA